MLRYHYKNRIVKAFQWDGKKSTLIHNIPPQYLEPVKRHPARIFSTLSHKKLKVYTIWTDFQIANVGDYIIFDPENESVPSGYCLVKHDDFVHHFQKAKQNKH